MVLHKTRIVNGQVVVGDLTVLLLCILIVISETPIIARNIPNVVFYGLVILFFLSSINEIIHLENHRKRTLIWLGAYLLLISIYKVLSISSAELAYYSTTIKYYFFLVAMLLIVGYMTKQQKVVIVCTIIGSMLFTVIDNCRLFVEYGASVYVHLFNWERFTTNSVNTTYVSSLLFLSGIMLVVFLHTKKRMPKVGAIVLIVLGLYFIARIAQRMLIFGLAVVMLPLVVLFNERRSKRRIIITIVFILLGILVLINISSVIDFADKLIGSKRLHFRFEQLKIVFKTGRFKEAGGTLSARYDLYLCSIDTWLSSFCNMLFGAGDHRDTNEIIGNHSNYIDECARYGIVGMFIWIPFTLSFMRSIGRCSGVRDRSPLMRQMKVIFLIFVLNALLSDVYESTVGIQMFILLPIVFSLLEYNDEDGRNMGSI